MTLDLDLFVTQLAKLRLAAVWIEKAITSLEQSGDYRASFDLGVPPPGSGLPAPDPEVAALLRQFAEQNVADQRKANQEVFARAVYVFAWAVFENLLEDCVRCAFTSSPQYLVPAKDRRSKEHLGLKVVKGVLLDNWTQEQVRDYMLDAELRTLRRLPSPEWARYFDKRLGVRWPDEALAGLKPIAERRNAAAHGKEFGSVSMEQLFRDIATLEAQGAGIAVAAAQKHGVPLRDFVYNKLKQPLAR